MFYIMLAMPLLALATMIQGGLGQDFMNDTEIVVDVPVDEVERNTSLETLRKTISDLGKDNVRLKEYLETLKKECDKNFKTWALKYKQIYETIKNREPEINDLNEQLANLLLRDEVVTEAQLKVRGYLEVLKLKKKIMTIDIDELLKRQREGDFDTCNTYGQFYNFEVRGEVEGRSLRARMSDLVVPEDESVIDRIMFGRKKAWLELRREEQMYLNVEHKKYIEYYTLYCQRRINFAKVLVEKITNDPHMSQSSEELKKKVDELKKNVTAKRDELQPLQKELYNIVPEIQRLQKIYDKQTDQVNCFLSLNRWNIDENIEQIKQLTNRTDNLDSIVAGGEILPSNTSPVYTKPIIFPDENK